eukprot:jgi/Tetstr1/448465/TSEL_035733.t1
MSTLPSNYDEPRLFCEHLELWRNARRDVIYDAGATLFRPADFAGTGSVMAGALREALKSSRWCFFAIGELDDLLDHVGSADRVKQEDFCDAFCRFVAWSLKPKSNKIPAELPLRSRQRRHSESSGVYSKAPMLGRTTAFRRRANSEHGAGAAASSLPPPSTHGSLSASPLSSRPSSPESLPPVASRSERRLPVFMKAAQGRYPSSAASVSSAQTRISGTTSCGSVPSTRDLIRNKHGVRSSQFVGGAAALNMRSSSSVFRAKLVTKKSMTQYLSIFKGMTVSSNRTVSMADFETHMARVAPELLPYAQRMYNTACKRGSKAANELDFESLLRVLFPSATKADVHELMEMVMERTAKHPNGPTAQQVDDANTIFKFWNKGGDSLLTFEEMEHGLEAMNMSEEDMDEWLEQLFGIEGTPDYRPCVGPGEFTSWFTSHAGELSL